MIIGNAVRETACTNCMHKDVCQHREDYLDMIKRLEEVYASFSPSRGTTFMEFVDPVCRHHAKKLQVPNINYRDLSGLSDQIVETEQTEETLEAIRRGRL